MSDKPSRVCGTISGVLAVLNGIALLVLALGGLRTRGRYRAIYHDLISGQTLPAATQLVLSVPSWTIILVAVVLLCLLGAKEHIRPKWVPLCLNVLWFLIGAVVSVLFAAVLLAPLMAMIQAMEKGQ
jgi:hypothetical protein